MMSLLKKKHARAIIISTLCTVLVSGAGAQAPFIDPADDEKYLAPNEPILFWTPHQQVAGYRNSEKTRPVRSVKTGRTTLALAANLEQLDGVEFSSGDETISVNEYFAQQSVAGLVVIKDGVIRYERYGLGNTKDSRWISFSVAKSITSMLIGAAIKDGYIGGVDEKITDYLPRLKGSSYDQSTIRDVLQMSSGVAWDEDYADPQSDINTAMRNWHTLKLYEYLRDKPRMAEPGEIFNYNTAETNLAGTLLRSAIGNNLATYLSEKIWAPFGMETEAVWSLSEQGGGEFGGCCISATLRDYGRLGMFALGNGRLAEGTEVLPDDWMAESTTPSKGYAGYGYFWWLHDNGVYSARGIFGQGIYIDPTENVVIALHSARPVASSKQDKDRQYALFAALANAVKD